MRTLCFLLGILIGAAIVTYFDPIEITNKATALYYEGLDQLHHSVPASEGEQPQ